MSSKRTRIVGWGGAVLLGFLAGLGTGRWIWRTGGPLPDSFTGAQDAVQQAYSEGIQAAQIFTLGVAGSVALIVLLLAAIIVRVVQSKRRDPP
mgnify:CR=1 FL=1